MDNEGGSTVNESLRRKFEAAWVENRPEPIEKYLPLPSDPAFLPTLEELVHIDLEFSWRRWTAGDDGTTQPFAEMLADPPKVERYLKQYPALAEPDILSRLVQQERTVRLACGDAVPIEEFRNRFPELLKSNSSLEDEMLAANSHDTTITGIPAVQSTDVERDPHLPPLGSFGSYELLEEIGRGGMGVVYRAYQRAVNRIVALKVIRGDCLADVRHDSQTSAIDRFRTEAQAAGRLQHDHIVTVYDVGEVDGSQFFSMRFVEGESLSEMIRQRPLDCRRAAEYLEPVTRALDHAHAAGILHRDLKPQNILVDEITDRALVADFGLAKLADMGVELTRAGEIMGTPAYMSPEQAKDTSQVTESSDIYSLGATLYCLITGRPPFQAATGVETLRQVMDQPPVSPRQLNPSIDRDLETITVKCLEKEVSKRYLTAGELAGDLRRYLNHQPIYARPIGLAGRTWRWCRRNPAVATLLSLATMFLLLALATATVGYIKTSRAYQTAEVARQDELRQRQKAQNQSRRAQENFRRAKEAVDRFFTHVSESTLLNQPGLQPLRRELLMDALNFYQRFVGSGPDDTELREELAATWYRIGRIHVLMGTDQLAWEALEKATFLQKELLDEQETQPRIQAYADTCNAMGQVLQEQRKLEDADQAYRAAVQLRERLCDAEPDNVDFQRWLANSVMNVGLVKKDSEQFVEARRQFVAAQDIRLPLLNENPDDLVLHRDVGRGYYALAQLALQLALQSEPPDQVRLTEARQHLEKAVTAFQHVRQREAADLNNQLSLSLCLRALADVLSELDQKNEAFQSYRQALSIIEPLAMANPDVVGYQARLAEVYLSRGELEHRGLQEVGDALVSFQSALEILQDLVKDEAALPEYRRELGVTLRAIGRCEHELGNQKAARQRMNRSRDVLSKLTEQFSSNPLYAYELSETERELKKLDKGRE